MTSDFQSKCRTCLSESNSCHQLLDFVDENYKILEMLDGLVPQIDVKNSLQISTLICQTCVDKLLIGYKFQEMCIQTNDHLNNMSQRVLLKTEPERLLDSLRESTSIQIKYEIKEEVDDCTYATDDLQRAIQTDYDNWHPNSDAISDDTDSSSEQLSVLQAKLPKNIPSKTKQLKRKSKHNNQQMSIIGTVCNLCHKDFRYNSKLQVHMRMHNDERPFPCTQCDKAFRTVYNLKNHLITHTDETPYVCSQCHKPFRHLNNFRQHMEIHTGLKKYQCSYCSSRFSRKSNLMRHESVHLNNTDPKHLNRAKRVEVINTENSQEAYIFIKKNSQHRDSTEKNDRQIVLDTNKVNHRKKDKVKFQDQQNFQCGYCFDCFENEDLLTAHCKNMHEKKDLLDVTPHIKVENDVAKKEIEDAPQIYQVTMHDSNYIAECINNDYENFNENSKQREEVESTKGLANGGLSDTNSHEIEKSRRKRNCNFPCETCGTVFLSASRLKRHIPVHSLARPHECEICNYRFETAVYLKIHLSKHINGTEKKLNVKESNSPSSDGPKDKIKPVCNMCGKVFANNYNLKEHMRLHSGESPYKCNHCGKTFHYSSNWKEHMRVHSGESPYKCLQCGNTFRHLSSLTRHMERHTGLRNYQCPECPSRFKCKTDLTKHMKSLHIKIDNSKSSSRTRNGTEEFLNEKTYLFEELDERNKETDTGWSNNDYGENSD